MVARKAHTGIICSRQNLYQWSWCFLPHFKPIPSQWGPLGMKKSLSLYLHTLQAFSSTPFSSSEISPAFSGAVLALRPLFLSSWTNQALSYCTRDLNRGSKAGRFLTFLADPFTHDMIFISLAMMWLLLTLYLCSLLVGLHPLLFLVLFPSKCHLIFQPVSSSTGTDAVLKLPALI